MRNDYMIAGLNITKRRKTPPATPYSLPTSENDISISGNRRQSHNYISYQAPPVTHDELFTHGLNVPAKDHTPVFSHMKSPSASSSATDELFLPPKNPRRKSASPVIPDELSIRRTSLRVHTVSSQLPQIASQPRIADELHFNNSTALPRSKALAREDAQLNLQYSPVGPYPQDNSGELMLPKLSSTAPYPQSNDTEPDWRAYKPPQELLSTEINTSTELESILAPSIRRVRDKYAEAEMRSIALQAEEPLQRLGGTPRHILKPELVRNSYISYRYQ